MTGKHGSADMAVRRRLEFYANILLIVWCIHRQVRHDPQDEEVCKLVKVGIIWLVCLRRIRNSESYSLVVGQSQPQPGNNRRKKKKVHITSLIMQP